MTDEKRKTKSEIYDECYKDMTPEQQERQRKLINGVQKKFSAHEKKYNQLRVVSPTARDFKMNLGEAGIKELLVALIMAGEL